MQSGTNSKRFLACPLLVLFSFGLSAQQSGSSGSIESSPRVSAGQPTLQRFTKTADGVSVCRYGQKAPSPPNGVLAPKPKYVAPKPTVTEEARTYVRDHHITNLPVSLVGLTVDEEGKPKDICVQKELGLGLDKKAFDTVARYRFEPATLDGKPVPVSVVIEVGFDFSEPHS